MRCQRTYGVIGAFVVLLPFTACGRFSGYENLSGTDACDPAAGGFSIDIDNSFFPLPVGHQVVLEGEEAGGHLLVRIMSLDETETVAGVESRVVEEYEAKRGEVVEISRNFFAQAQDGTVCYFGEDVDIYDGAGNITSHSGAWRAGVGGNRPGIFMPPTLEVGLAFQQEIAPGIAEDQAKVIALGEATEVPAGTFEETATLRDGSPLDGSSGEKVYARGIGLIVDGPARLTRYSPLGL
ncbi:MAG: hypothetical protein ACRDG9_13915 [Actinomycetota bacterium]